MKTQEKISNKNGNWYIVDLRRVTTWGNHHLIKASTPEKAFDKAVKLGKEAEYKFTNAYKIEMEWIFVGIGELLPVYEDIEDGAELMWTDYGFISNRRTMRMPYKKEQLIKLLKSNSNSK
jgi:hypothetical protein